MAEITPDSALAEVISSLDLASVPEKLHCSTCHGFLLNAYKTSCCEQNVCEKCFLEITDHCPMCKHKPFSKELCRPAKAMRNTVKAYLKNIEKTLSDDRARVQLDQMPAGGTEKVETTEVVDAQAEANLKVENGTLEKPLAQSEEPAQDLDSLKSEVQPSIEVGSPSADQQGTSLATLQNDDANAQRQPSMESDANDDEVEIQVEPSNQDEMMEIPQAYEMDEQDQQYDNGMVETMKNGDTSMHDMSNGMDPNSFMQNMMGFNGMGMDMNMMQQMMNMNMSMNHMMSMGMGPMFGGFNGSNGNMNGMNMMGMNYNSNQLFNGWNGQNSNMWQNNNAINAMGGDFGSQFGSSVSQQGNFYSQQFPNGDFNGYNGRYGRGRGRGGRGSFRGRNSYNQYQQNSGYHNAHEQQQYEIQNMQAQMTQNVNGQDESTKGRANHKEEESHDQDDFAPGGQDEVQEALGDDDRDSKPKTNESTPNPKETETSETTEQESTQQERLKDTDNSMVQETPAQEKIIPEAYHEDFDNMAPPTAPTGPSGRYNDKEFAFRARGHGKYSLRGRGSFSGSTGFPASPVRSVSQSSLTAASPPTKGLGVVGAPTGPRAMREPPASKPAPRSASNVGGFQIMGRASMTPQGNRSREDDQPRSASPANGHDDRDDDRYASRRYSRYDEGDDIKREADSESNYDHDRTDRGRDRKSKRSKRADHRDDYEMEDADQGYESVDRRSSHRGSRYEKERSRKDEKYSSSSKHRSSRRHYEDEGGDEYEKDDYGEPAGDKHRSSRSGKLSSKYESTRDRDRDSHRDRRRERDRDRDHDEERARDKDDKHRKRSRHDRDRDDEYDDPDDEESRHRSRRHKKEHHSSNRRDRDKDMDDSDLGLRISGRSNSNRQSALPTPTSATSSMPPTSFADVEKDPHTLEREARNRERMVKEQQRREKAALDKRGGTTTAGKSSRITTSGGRRVSYKYEDEVERGMGAADEREKARWR